MKEMDEEQRIFARNVYKSFFDRCKLAMDNEFYFEAILMESAAIEGRINVILNILRKPCAMCSEDISHQIGLQKKIGCLHKLMRKNPELFKGSPLSVNKRFVEMKQFCTHRNNRIHDLYQNLDKYEKRIEENKKIAEQGYKICKLLFDECKRFRDIYHNHYELIENANLGCEGELTEFCQKAMDEVSRINESSTQPTDPTA